MSVYFFIGGLIKYTNESDYNVILATVASLHFG